MYLCNRKSICKKVSVMFAVARTADKSCAGMIRGDCKKLSDQRSVDKSMAVQTQIQSRHILHSDFFLAFSRPCLGFLHDKQEHPQTVGLGETQCAQNGNVVDTELSGTCLIKSTILLTYTCNFALVTNFDKSTAHPWFPNICQHKVFLYLFFTVWP